VFVVIFTDSFYTQSMVHIKFVMDNQFSEKYPSFARPYFANPLINQLFIKKNEK
jgi:hypothetical protein